MKKTLLALSLAGFFASSASAVMVYNNNGTQLDISGSARVMVTKTSGDNANERVDLKNDGSRVKFKFSQALGEGFRALGYMELRPSNIDFGSSISTKYLYAGLDVDNLGQLTFGRQKTAGDAFKLADPAEQDQAINVAVSLATEADKVVHFKTANMDGFGIEASYLFDQDATKLNSSHKYNANANGYQFLTKYQNQFSDLAMQLNLLYAHSNKGGYVNEGANPIVSTQKIYGVSAGIKVADLGLAMDYAKSKESKKHTNGVESSVDGVQVALTYQVTAPMDVYALYHHYSKNENGKTNDMRKVITNGFGVGSHYYLSKNVMSYVEYNRDKSTDKSASDNGAYVGLRVYF